MMAIIIQMMAVMKSAMCNLGGGARIQGLVLQFAGCQDHQQLALSKSNNAAME